jgi:glycosyltransferase involved in cell wall biosynthesis
MVEISVIIPCLNEEKYIVSCVESILEANVENKSMEIFFVDGMSSDKTQNIIQEYSQKYPFIQLLENPKKCTPIAMNIGINASQGKHIFILSAHATYDTNYFLKLSAYCDSLEAACTGAVLTTEVKHKTDESIAIKEVLMHPFGVGNASFRTGSNKIKEVDTVAFGCYERKTFEKYGLFDEKLIRNQDIELNKRIVNGGGKIYLIPEVKCTYYAREYFMDLAKNQYQNGFWNVLTAYYTNTFSSLSLRHFIPLFFVLSLLIPLLLSWFTIKFLWIAFFSLVSYLSLVIIISLRLNHADTNLLSLVKAFLTLHFSYGVGSFVGMLFIIKKYIRGEK